MAKTKSKKDPRFKDSYSGSKVSSKDMIEVITEALLSKKAKDVVVMDVSALTTLTDYFVVAHGNSDVQVKALADAVEDDLRIKMEERVWKKEGHNTRSWIILDYVNVVVHVMSKEKRDYYSIERMWNDAVITKVEDETIDS